MHLPLTDIQADFEMNWPTRYQITAKKKLLTQTNRRTDVTHDNNRDFFRKKEKNNTKIEKKNTKNQLLQSCIIVKLK